MTSERIRLVTGEQATWRGDVNELAPDLSTFFPNRSRPEPITPLPLVAEKDLKNARPHLAETFMPAHMEGEMKRRGLAMLHQRWSVSMVAARLGISVRQVYRWRADADAAAGIIRPVRKLAADATSERMRRGQALLDANWSAPQVAAHLGVDIRTVARWRDAAAREADNS